MHFLIGGVHVLYPRGRLLEANTHKKCQGVEGSKTDSVEFVVAAGYRLRCFE